MNPLGKAVLEKRSKQSLRDLAAELEESFTIFAAVEKGRIPQVRVFVKLMGGLGIVNRSAALKMLDYTNERRTR